VTIFSKSEVLKRSFVISFRSSFVVTDLKKRLEVGTAQITSIKKEFSETVQVAKQANMSSNYNEQYSRKNNIKVFNFPRREKQNLRQDFINLVKRDLNVTLEEMDVVAIHRLPAEHELSSLITTHDVV
jgi:alpha-galactosidase